MRTRCGRNDRGLPGPALAGAADAVEALRLSASSGGGEECVVVLVCDDDRRVVLALDFVGAPAAGAPQVMELVATAMKPAAPFGVVVGLFHADPDPALVADIEYVCEPAGIDVLDVLVVCGGDLWWSLSDG